ncbi:MAG TPA: hypothetical protein VLE99_02965 [Candidatus Saccharimonadales bacterium]|nr:hypothetical protein [Candidatus Saccharimonadales bacterium]
MFASISSSIKQNGKYLVGLVIASLIGGLTATAVQAAIPDSNGNINACYKGTKVFYVTDPAGNCKAGETPLSWMQSSPGGDGAQAYGSITADSTPDGAAVDPNFSAHIARAVIPPRTTTLCIIFDDTVVAPKQILITKERSAGDVVGAGLVNGPGAIDSSMCPAGTGAVLDGSSNSPTPVFVRVY